MSKFVQIVRTSILVAAVCGVSVPAVADTLDNVPTMKVSYADLDLTTDSGQNRLQHRLISAARSVCSDTGEIGTRIQAAHDACYKQAMTRANAEFAVLVSNSQPRVAIADRSAPLSSVVWGRSAPVQSRCAPLAVVPDGMGVRSVANGS